MVIKTHIVTSPPSCTHVRISLNGTNDSGEGMMYARGLLPLIAFLIKKDDLITIAAHCYYRHQPTHMQDLKVNKERGEKDACIVLSSLDDVDSLYN